MMDYTDIEEWQEWWAHTIGSKICKVLGHKVENSWCSRCWTDISKNIKLLARRPDDAVSLISETPTGLHLPFSQDYHRRVRVMPPTQDSDQQGLDKEPPREASPG